MSAITGAASRGRTRCCCAGQRSHVTGELDDGDLQPEAQAEIGHVVLARVARGGDLALDAALAEAARHEDRVHVASIWSPCCSMSVAST
jgi:hypothetical protein